MELICYEQRRPELLEFAALKITFLKFLWSLEEEGAIFQEANNINL